MPELKLHSGWKCLCISGMLSASFALAHAQSTATPASQPKATETETVSAKDVKKSEKLFNRALRLHSEDGKLSESFEVLEESTALNPTQPTYAMTREYVRQELVSKHLDRGNQLLEQNRKVEAVAEFREALALDPKNSFAEQRLRDAWAEAPAKAVQQTTTLASEPELVPKPGKQNFSFRGDSRQLWQNIGRAFGITVDFDESFQSRPVRLDATDLDFPTAIQIARKLTHSFDVPISMTEMTVAADTQDVRRKLQRMSLRTFYMPAGSPQEFQEVVNILRTMLEIRFISTNASSGMVQIRAPLEDLNAAAQIIENMSEGRPQVLFEISALQLSENLTRQIGISLPLQFTIFNLNTELRALGPNAQDLINRFNAGTLTLADLAAAQAALAANQNSPLTKGFATFGGGMTRFGVVIPPATAQFNYNKSSFKSLQHMTLRADQGQAATFRVGERFPVITGTFASSLSSVIPQNLQQQVALQPIAPSFNFEDLGITLKATPQVNGNSDVTVQLELQIKALGGTSFNDIPTISNREYKGTITVRDGETSVLGGSMDMSEQRSLSGMPWLSRVPGLGRAVSASNKQASSSEILLLITPHVLRPRRDKDLKTETFFDGN